MPHLSFWLFIGVEFIIPVAKDLKNPRRDVLLSMTIRSGFTIFCTEHSWYRND